MKPSLAVAIDNTIKSPRRAELAAIKAEIRELRDRQNALSAPNPRLEAALQAERNAQAALAAVDEAERADLRRYIEHGGNAVQPRTDERRRAEVALTAAKNGADVARSVEAECQSKIAVIGNELSVANGKMRDLVVSIIIEEAFPEALRHYTAGIVAVNEAWQGVLAVIDLLFQNNKAGAVTTDATALPRAIIAPMDRSWRLPDAQVVVDTVAMQREARAKLQAFVEELTSNADAPLPDAA